MIGKYERITILLVVPRLRSIVVGKGTGNGESVGRPYRLAMLEHAASVRADVPRSSRSVRCDCTWVWSPTGRIPCLAGLPRPKPKVSTVRAAGMPREDAKYASRAVSWLPFFVVSMLQEFRNGARRTNWYDNT